MKIIDRTITITFEYNELRMLGYVLDDVITEHAKSMPEDHNYVISDLLHIIHNSGA